MHDKTITKKERFVVWGSVIFYCSVLFLLSAQSDLALPDIVPNTDKIAHLSAYALLGWLCARAWRFERPNCSAVTVILFSLLFVAIYGATDEWHQAYVPGRTSDRWDWLADMCGGIMGGSFFTIWERLKDLILRQVVS